MFPVLLGRSTALPTPLFPVDVSARGKPLFQLKAPVADQPPISKSANPEAPETNVLPFAETEAGPCG